MYRIQSVKTKEELIVVATFFDGFVMEYDIKKILDAFPQFLALKDEALFKKVKVDVGGYAIIWNDDLDLDADTIREDGVKVGCVPITPQLQLAANLTEARHKVHMTQKQLAEKTGIYQADISKIERGIGNPSVDTLQRLAKGMGLSIEIIFKENLY